MINNRKLDGRHDRQSQQEADRIDWFVRSRFGLFIHWGIYALPARHEWIKFREKIDDEKYDEYFRRFDPDLYDPATWAREAARTGMKYFVITTKHHDGFCLWDSRFTDYKAPATPAGRDLLRPMVEAFRAEGLRVGFYHSLVDWHHPDFTIDSLHPQFDHPDREELNRARRWERYVEYLHGQVRELLTDFGRIDILWLDMSYPARYRPGRPGWIGKGREDWQSEKLLAMIRELQPNIIVNDRLDLKEVKGGWDFITPEQSQPRMRVTAADGQPAAWEACHTFSGSWGYHRDEASWKSADQLVRMLVDSVSKGGNMLLNVGPTARGEFHRKALGRLREIGEWMRRHGRSIYDCTEAPPEFTAPPDSRLTWNPDTSRLYLHLFAWPFRHVHLEAPTGQVAYCQLLDDGSEIPFDPPVSLDEGRETVRLYLPVPKPDTLVPVVEIFLRAGLGIDPGPGVRGEGSQQPDQNKRRNR